jgi:AcrR family transcriptional regulator
MGLRELNAARTRALIADAAYALFAEQGYEDTTMEQVADRADVGTSTLYRYFPTKELLALAPLGAPGVMAAEVSRRTVGEPVDEVLGHAVLALLADSDETSTETMRQLVEDNPRLNAGLLDWLTQEYGQLVAALAVRTGRPTDDPALRASAWLAVFVLQQVGEVRRPGRRGLSSEAVARRVMDDLAAAPLVLPTSPPA